MKMFIKYDSLTGNTKMLAEAIKNKYKNNLTESLEEADLVFVGSWTNRGNCTDNIKKFLQTINNKKIFLFGTCGFGGDQNYYDAIFNRTKQFVNSSNIMIGHFYCQGKMPMATRDKYINMIHQNPEDKNLLVSLENFDKALEHPNSNDIEKLMEILTNLNL